MHDPGGDGFSEVADEQLDRPERAQAMPSAITTTRGIVMRLPVPGSPPLKVFWTSHGDDGDPRIEAVLDRPAGRREK